MFVLRLFADGSLWYFFSACELVCCRGWFPFVRVPFPAVVWTPSFDATALSVSWRLCGATVTKPSERTSYSCVGFSACIVWWRVSEKVRCRGGSNGAGCSIFSLSAYSPLRVWLIVVLRRLCQFFGPLARTRSVLEEAVHGGVGSPPTPAPGGCLGIEIERKGGDISSRQRLRQRLLTSYSPPCLWGTADAGAPE